MGLSRQEYWSGVPLPSPKWLLFTTKSVVWCISKADSNISMNFYKCVHLCNYHLGQVVVHSSLLFNCQIMSYSLQPHGLQHGRLPCPSPSPRVCPNLCPLNQWCHLIISSSVVPFSFCLQSVPHQGLFQWVDALPQLAKVLELQLQHQSSQCIFRIYFL